MRTASASRITLPYMAYSSPFAEKARFPALKKRLSVEEEFSALILFRRGLDTVAIGAELECTPAAAANGLANARERERGQ